MYIGRKKWFYAKFQGSGVYPEYKHNQDHRFLCLFVFLFLETFSSLVLYKITKIQKGCEPRPSTSIMYSNEFKHHLVFFKHHLEFSFIIFSLHFILYA